MRLYNGGLTGRADEDLELAVLSCMVFDEEAAIAALSGLADTDFTRFEYRVVFSLCAEVVAGGAKLDVISVAAEGKKRGTPISGDTLARIGGSVSTAVNIGKYITSLRELRQRREVVAFAERIIEAATTKASIADVFAVLSDTPNFENCPADKPTGVIMQEAIDRMAERYMTANQRIPGNETGLFHFDNLTGGVKDGELILLSADPNVGKSALLMQMCIRFAKAGKRAAYFNYEMSEAQIGDRLVAIGLPFDIKKLKYPREHLDEKDLSYIQNNKMQAVLDEYLPVFTNTKKTAAEIATKCKELRLRGRPVSFIGVDYLQLMRGEGVNENERLEKICLQLKAIAKELSCPLILITSLNRQGQTRGSGSLDFHADQIWHLNRAHTDADEKARAVARIEIRKNRDGGKGVVDLLFQEKHLRFTEPARTAKNDDWAGWPKG